MNNLEELLEKKKADDKKQRIITTVIVSLSIVAVLVIFSVVTITNKTNVDLIKNIDTTKLVTQRLNDTIQFYSKELKSDIILCVGKPTRRITSNGLPKYNFTFEISDSAIISNLLKVDYYFADDSYNPKLKSSDNAENKFKIFVNDSWGCMKIVPIYLHYKNDKVDTLLFRMCDKARLDLPEIR